MDFKLFLCRTCSGVARYTNTTVSTISIRQYSNLRVSRRHTLSPTVANQRLDSKRPRNNGPNGSQRSSTRPEQKKTSSSSQRTSTRRPEQKNESNVASSSSHRASRRPGSNVTSHVNRINIRRTQSGRGPTGTANSRSYLPTGSTSVTTTLGTGNKFSVLYQMDRQFRESHKNLLSKVDSFDALKIEPSIRQIIMERVLDKDAKPTPIQTLAVKAIQARRKNPLEQHNWLMAAETGSGKTLAYLAPMLSKLKEEETDEDWPLIKELPGVRAVILVPSAELISQLTGVINKIQATMRFSYLACLPGQSQRFIHRRLAAGVDILICTPDKLAQLSKNNKLQSQQYLQNCKFLVIDEADSLMNDSFRDATLSSIELMPNLLDLIFCTATIPRQFDRILREKYPNMIRLVTPKIHKLPGHIDFRVVEVFRPPYMDNKLLALKQALFAIYHDGTEDGFTKRVMVFVNRKESVNGIVSDLNTSGYLAVGIDGTLKPDERATIIQDFISPPKTVEESGGIKLRVLVTTDLMARGVDTNRVKNIIIYDLPLSSADLLHRAGRTGRINSRGRVLLLVNKKESQSWVKGLEKVVKSGLALA